MKVSQERFESLRLEFIERQRRREEHQALANLALDSLGDMRHSPIKDRMTIGEGLALLRSEAVLDDLIERRTRTDI